MDSLLVAASGVLRSRLLTQFDWLEHGFGTIQAGPFDGEPVATVKQVHGTAVVTADRNELVGEGDALVTATPGVAVTVRTADCVPVLIVDPRQRVVAAVHAGWRGTAAKIAGVTVQLLQRDFGSLPHELAAAIGPCINQCCFEVGPEVAREFQDQFPERIDLAGRTRIDLPEANRRQLANAGVGTIELARWCTMCDRMRLHSFRRDREAAGRLVSGCRIRKKAGEPSGG